MLSPGVGISRGTELKWTYAAQKTGAFSDVCEVGFFLTTKGQCKQECSDRHGEKCSFLGFPLTACQGEKLDFGHWISYLMVHSRQLLKTALSRYASKGRLLNGYETTTTIWCKSIWPLFLERKASATLTVEKIWSNWATVALLSNNLTCYSSHYKIVTIAINRYSYNPHARRILKVIWMKH